MMIKKFFLIIIFVFSIFFFNFEISKSVCTYSEWWSLASNIEECFRDTNLVRSEDLEVTGDWFSTKILNWKNGIAFYLWIFAALWIVFSGFTLITSWWNDEKIWKAKNIFKWTLAWLLVVIFASAIITLVVNLFYSF